MNFVRNPLDSQPAPAFLRSVDRLKNSRGPAPARTPTSRLLRRPSPNAPDHACRVCPGGTFRGSRPVVIEGGDVAYVLGLSFFLWFAVQYVSGDSSVSCASFHERRVIEKCEGNFHGPAGSNMSGGRGGIFVPEMPGLKTGHAHTVRSMARVALHHRCRPCPAESTPPPERVRHLLIGRSSRM